MAPSWRSTGPPGQARVADRVSSGGVARIVLGVQPPSGSQMIVVCAVPPGSSRTADASTCWRRSENTGLLGATSGPARSTPPKPVIVHGPADAFVQTISVWRWDPASVVAPTDARRSSRRHFPDAAGPGLGAAEAAGLAEAGAGVADGVVAGTEPCGQSDPPHADTSRRRPAHPPPSPTGSRSPDPVPRACRRS